MLFNHFKIALRSLSKNRFFTLLNIAGLSIGLSAGLLILLWVKDEMSFDRFHPNVDRIYREHAHFKAGDETQVWERCPAPHAAYALREIPEVEKAVRITDAGAPLFRQGTTAEVEKLGVFADTSFFEVFKTDFLAGNPAAAFSGNASVVLTESLARKYFGAATAMENVTGKTVQIDKDYVTVSAVIRDFPENTLLQYSYIRPYEYLKSNFQPNDYWKSLEEDWGDFDNSTYYRLRPGANAAVVAGKLGEIQHAHNTLDPGSYYSLQPLDQIHLYAADGTDAGARMVRIMGMAALFIILIAAINYINLATAKAGKRAREVGLRKAVGASRGQLIRQFLVESGLVFLMSSALAVGITYLLLPYCNNIADKKLRLDWSDPSLMLLTAGILGGALLLSSIYPAVILSAFNPLQTIKSQFTNGNDRQARLRQALVVTQFVCSSALLIAMFIVNRQMQFIRNQNLGFDRENVFQMRLTELTYKNRDAIISELKSSPGVVAVTSSSDNIMQSGSSTGDTDWDGKTADQHMIVAPMAIGPDYLDFFKMTLTAGSNFTGTKADSTSFIINETAAAQLGMADPVGKRFKLWQTEGTIIGVVKDYHFASLHETIKPAILFSAPNRHGVICVKTTGAEASKAVASAEKQWKRFDPAYPFEFKFMDESFDKMYRTEQRATQLFRAFSVIALLISCLGLFGLSAFMAEQRTKEIGIRKVLGSSISGITALLARDFLKPVLLAFVIATPLAWYFMREWLSDFAYRTEIQWWIFAVVGLATVAVAFLTVCFQSIRAALANPVKSLRSE